MRITKKRVRKAQNYLAGINQGETFYLGAEVADVHAQRMTAIGFRDPFTAGQRVLPAPLFGPVSRFNALGRVVVHKDQPMETAYRQVYWEWTQWHGRDRIPMSDFRDVPYQRYPRTHTPAPGLELQLAEGPEAKLLIVSGPHSRTAPALEMTAHAMSLFLEVFGYCDVLKADLAPALAANVLRLNWEVLPEGEYPWERLREHVGEVIREAKSGNRRVVEERLRVIADFNPTFVAVGRGGFRGYVIFGFPDQGLFVCESAWYGNATYVFGQDWRTLSQMTKAEILRDDLQSDRLVHVGNWASRVTALLR